MNAYNRLLEQALLPLGDRLIGSSFMAELRRVRSEQYLSAESLAQLQITRLRDLLRFCNERVPYYKNLGIEPHEDPRLWIKQFPILYKRTLHRHMDQLLSVDRAQLTRCASSGSSGEQVYVYVNQKEISISRAYQVLWWEWAGYRIGDPLFQTGITPHRGRVKGFKDLLFRTLYVPAFGLKEADVLSYLNRLKNRKPCFLAGYASSLYVMAQIAKKHNLKHLRFKGAISWGDKLFDHYKQIIQEVFGVRIFDTYGCGEGFKIAAEKDLPYKYINTPHVYLEIVDEAGNPVPDGELGYVLLTRLDAFSMPLLRYYVGDLAAILPREAYPEHRDLAYPLLKQIVGRDTDIVKTPEGNQMIVHFFSAIFEHFPQIRQFRVIQRELSAMEVEYIANADFHEDILVQLTSIMQNHLKEPAFRILYRPVSQISATPSGKPQIIQSFLETEHRPKRN